MTNVFSFRCKTQTFKLMTIIECYLELNNNEIADYFTCYTTEHVNELDYIAFLTDMFTGQLESYIEEEAIVNIEDRYTHVLNVNLICLPVDEDDVDKIGFNIPMGHYFHLPYELTKY